MVHCGHGGGAWMELWHAEFSLFVETSPLKATKLANLTSLNISVKSSVFDPRIICGIRVILSTKLEYLTVAFILKTLIVISRINFVGAYASTMSLFNLPPQDPDKLTLLKCLFKCLLLQSKMCKWKKMNPWGAFR